MPSGSMNTLILLTGTNMGNRLKNMNIASHLIAEQIGSIRKYSQLYVTEPWGNYNQPDFINQVIITETTLSAPDCLAKILEIEKRMGRVRTIKNAPRFIDIDILFYNDEILKMPSLTIPHPEIENRRFVLTPLDEVCPEFIHPGLQESAHVLLLKCKDPLSVREWDEK